MRSTLLLFGRKYRIGTAFVFTFIALIAAGAIWRSWSVPRLNVILVTFDTTRADRLGIYGYQQGVETGFDEFAKRGVVFERAYAPAPITLPSHATMLTGLYPPEHGLRLNGEGRLADTVPLLPQILRQQGYDTGAFIAAVVLDSMFGLARGFDTYDDDLSKATRAKFSDDRRRDGQAIMNSALAWLKRRKARPFFCWIHLYDAHGPYDMRSEFFGKKFEQNPYDAGVATELQAFDRLLAFLKEHKLDQNTMVVVAADHGEGLDEHLENEHAMLVYNTTLHVPLVFVGPRDCQPGLRVANPVSLTDLMPTVLDLLGIPAPRHVSGRSLRAALKGAPMSSTVCYAEAITPFELNHWCPLETVISGRWKYIQTTRPELYDLQADPGELLNLAESNVDECQQMRNVLEAMQESFSRSEAQKVKLSDQDRENLMALGYVAGGRQTSDAIRSTTEALPDIKDMLPYLAMYEKARLLTLQGNFEDAIGLVQEIVHARDDYATAFVLLGECLLEVKRPDEAVDAFQSALKLRPDFTKVRLSLARCLAAHGHFDEAVAELMEVIKQDPDTALNHYLLARALVELQRFDDAIVQFRQAIQISPDYLAAHLHLGQLFVKIDRPADAVPCFDHALRLDPTNGVAFTNLLKVLLQLGETESALKSAQRFAEGNPASFEARFNLGFLLTARKRYAEGISELREAQKLRPDDPRPLQQIQQAEAALKRAGG